MRGGRPVLVLAFVVGLLGLSLRAWNRAGHVPDNLWRTPDRQGSRLFDVGAFTEAAVRFRDPDWKGVAHYRAGAFEEAASTFGFRESAEAFYNRGNALVMLGRYAEAIDSYDRSVRLRPDWREAQENRALALARKERLAPPDDDHGGTGGKLGADEIVISDRPKKPGHDETDAAEGEGSVLSDQEIRAMWLRRVETRPADFLRLKFSYQLATEDIGEMGTP